jgi:hypothetical protein
MKTQTIVGIGPEQCTGTLVRDHDKYPVYLLDDGRFAVDYGGKWVIKPTMRSIDNLLKIRKSIKLFQFGSIYHISSRDVRVVDVADMSGNKVIDKDGKKHYEGYNGWHVYDEKIVTALLDLAERARVAQVSFEKEFTKIIKKAKRVHKHDFAVVLAKEK